MNIIKSLLSICALCIFLLTQACSADTNKTINADGDSSVFFNKKKKENYVICSPFEGVLVKDGEPLAGARLIRKLRWNGNEDGLIQEFVTNEEGAFSLPVYEEVLTLSMLSQFVGKIDIKYVNDGVEEYIWIASKFGPEIYAETEGRLEDLVCDLSNEEIAVHMSSLAILTKCRWKDMPN